MSGPKPLARLDKETKVTTTNEQQYPPVPVDYEKISEAAYFKWEAAGCRCGDGVEFWLQAEAQLAADIQSSPIPS